MAPSNEDQAIGQLVTKLTGLNSSSSEWSKAVQKAKYKLRYEKCTSTSEKEVNDSYDGLVEKFDIKGHSNLSKALAKYKAEYLKKTRPIFNGETNQSILKYDLLRLLLSLSSSYNQNYDYIPTLKVLADNPNLTWKELIEDDPLEGDHWKTWSDENSTDEDELSDLDDFELDENKSNQKKQAPPKPAAASELRMDYTDQMDIDSREDIEGLNYLLTQQYWRDDYEMRQDNNGDESILVNPNKLSQALGRLLYNDRERQQLTTITEVAVIREVLGFLRGYSGVIFQSHNNTFMMNENYIVQHLSQYALVSILKEFFKYGTILADLRKTVDHILEYADYGQTSEAFVECMHKLLADFDNTMATLEADTSMISIDPVPKIISILKLKSFVDPIMTNFKVMHTIVAGLPVDNSPREISTFIISSIYSHALTAQTSGQNHLYDTLLYVLQQVVIPYGQIMDDWVFRGSLKADKFNEFYVTRNEQISTQDSDFWTDGFSIQPIDQNNYCYECPMFDPSTVSRIFFTGKAINLLSHVEKIQKKQQLADLPNQRFFSKVMKEDLPTKTPFIQPIRQETVIHVKKDSYTHSLFPLTKPRDTTPVTEMIEESNIGSLFDQQFIESLDTYIREPYQVIASDLNKVLHQHCGLKEQLQSLASLYLMLENDLMHSFCEAIFSKIDQNKPWFDQRILNQTFTEACKTSGYHELVFIETRDIRTSEPMSSASYLEYIRFNVEISWPLNNFIQKEQLPNYSKILRFLFRLKRAKYVMEKKTLFTGRSAIQKTNSTVMHFYALRMKILWFINAFWRYIMTTILHAETINFQDKLSLSKDADEITALHNSYIRRLVDRCLLNEKASAIRKSIMSILDMTEQMKTLFVDYLEPNQDMDQLNENLHTIERDFNRTNEFLTLSLNIMAKKASLPWFESLAASLLAQ